MTRLPPKELLESVHRFPCDYTFKVVGADRPDFVADVLTCVTSVLLPGEEPPTHSIRRSGSGRHLAVTAVVRVRSADLVLEIYDRLKGVDGLAALF